VPIVRFVRQHIDLRSLLTYQFQKHCFDFKDNKYPKLVQLADFVYNYAVTVGGNINDSIYANIIMYGKQLFAELQKPKNEQNQHLIAQDQAIIQGLIQGQLDQIDTFQTAAAQVAQDLTEFGNTCQSDQEAIQTCSDKLNRELTGLHGQINTLTQQLSSLHDSLAADQQQYLNGMHLRLDFPVEWLIVAC
jgi:DNA repair exonuclease SbcCD ATPase subunit